MEPIKNFDDLRDYLDKAITAWRGTRDKAKKEDEKQMAMHYIDAFQSIRLSVFNTLLEPEPETKENPNPNPFPSA